MKRVKYACLEQTIHFQLKEDNIGHEAAMKAVKDELENYKSSLDRKHTKYKILDEQVQSDGSIIIKIKRQYNDYSCGEYLD